METTQRLKVREFLTHSYSKFRADKLILSLITLAVVFVVLSLLTLFFKAGELPREVPLFYSLPWGEERLARPLMLVILPASSFFLFVFNLFWAAIFYEKEILLSRILAWTSAFISFLSFYTLIRIIFLIT